MRLPPSRDNVYPGLYFAQTPDSRELCQLINIESANEIFLRVKGAWIPYPDMEFILDNLPFTSVNPKLIFQAIAYVDDCDYKVTPLKWLEIDQFQHHVLY
jgi:hypothetical protein